MLPNQKDLLSRFQFAEEVIKESKSVSLLGFSPSPGANPIQLHSKHKSSFKDIVTEFDQKVEDFILGKIAAAFPEDGLLGEEASHKLNGKAHNNSFSNEYLWVLDPIDGTANYSRSYPYFCTTLSLMKKINGTYEITLAFTFDPVRNELFHAIKNQGAYLNHKRIQVSDVSELEKSLLVTGFASDIRSKKELIFDRFVELTRKTLGVRRTGAAALDLAYVACGRLDAYWECGLSAWDVAAGSLLVREANGVVSHFERSEEWSPWTGEILATNKVIFETILSELKKIQ